MMNIIQNHALLRQHFWSRTLRRHCERSEAIHSCIKNWIASSLALLAIVHVHQFADRIHQKMGDSMRDNSFDRTIERNYVQKWRFLIAEYEEVKAGRSTTFRRVGDFYRHHGTCSQSFRKYYNRYLRSGAEADLPPQRRGPKWRERRKTEGNERGSVGR